MYIKIVLGQPQAQDVEICLRILSKRKYDVGVTETFISRYTSRGHEQDVLKRLVMALLKGKFSVIGKFKTGVTQLCRAAS
jgi:hypothetical protein